MSFTEYKTVEKEILEELQKPELGWRYEEGDVVTRQYRHNDEQEMLLIPILRQKLKLLNPDAITSDERADVVITRLRALRDNQEWLAWLRNEKTMQFAQDEKHHTIRLVDYDTIKQNDFLATNQLWIQGEESCRPDILLFLNGIPVVDIEAKTASRGHLDWAEGAKQTGRYQQEIPNLMYSNCFCAGVNELRMYYGVPGVRLQYWHQWRDPSPHTHIPEFDAMNCTLYGLFDRGNLLDIIRNFIVFEAEAGTTVKKVARYHQFREANELVRRSLELDQPSSWRRGIVWHTQGSGKSLTMIFAARKLWNHHKLAQPTIIIVVDREQLQDQMLGELYKTNTENVAEAISIRDLRRLVRGQHRGIIVTIVNKFDGMQPELSTRPNIIMLVDEAHRSQYGDLGIFMRSAMPQASMFGLTGTPLELSDRNTPRTFGRQLDEDRYERYMGRPYTIADSIRDGTTKELRYEIRMTDWTVAYADLDKKFAELFAEKTPEEQKLLKGEARLDAILKHPKRIEQISQDIARHFRDHVRPNGFKAMVVCRDKDMCALYKTALDQVFGDDVKTLVIISEDKKHDPGHVKQYYLGKKNRRTAIDEFKKPCPKDPAERETPENKYRSVEIFIVCDMLLTGFNAPILQTMYLDKGLRDHTLLQAIARVNRPYTDLKECGLILDYFGIFEDLNQALNYDKSELGEIAFPFKQFREMFKEQIEELSGLFSSIDRSGSHQSLMQALLLLNDDDQKRNQFEKQFRNLKILFETLQPSEFLRPYLDEYKWLCKLYMLYRKKFYPTEHFEITDEDGAKTRALIREYVDVKEIEAEFPSYTLDENFLIKIRDEDPDTKALEIEAALDAEIRIRLEEDEDVRPISVRLQRIITQKRAGTLAGVALLRELEELTAQMVDIIQESERPVVSSIAKEVKKRLPDLADEDSMEVAEAILVKAREKCFESWWLQSHMDTELYREFTILLAKEFKDLQLHGKDQDFVDRCIRLLKKVRFTPEDKQEQDHE
jgi:type I restriction enzyme R subunit